MGTGRSPPEAPLGASGRRVVGGFQGWREGRAKAAFQAWLYRARRQECRRLLVFLPRSRPWRRSVFLGLESAKQGKGMIFLRCRPECYSCLEKLAERTARGAGGDRQALKAGLAFLEANFDYRRIPTILAGEIQRVIRKEAKNPDPFAAIKEKEMPLGRMLAEKYALPREASLEDAVAFAAKGNSLDFFLELDLMEKEMAKPVEFVRNDVPQLLSLLEGKEKGRRQLYSVPTMPGNATLISPLWKLSRWGKVYYAAKDSPVQNDLTVADLGRSGIAHLLTGSLHWFGYPGLDPASVPLASWNF